MYAGMMSILLSRLFGERRKARMVAVSIVTFDGIGLVRGADILSDRGVAEV
jgi:drug/metabolite transporter (DMT)-like permease